MDVLTAAHLSRRRLSGLDPKTAIRYADEARALLVTTAEKQGLAGSREPEDCQSSMHRVAQGVRSWTDWMRLLIRERRTELAG
jgi:hypothetical protein